MPRIKTKELTEKIEKGEYTTIRLRALPNGVFCMLLETANEIYIHENLDGRIKEYPQVSYALAWLEKIVDVKKVLIDKRVK